MPSFKQPISGNLKLIGDKVAVEFCKDQSLDTPGDTYDKPTTKIHLPDEAYRGVVKAIVRFVGNQMSESEIRVGSYVLVPEFAGATPVKFNDTTLKLYNTKDCLALLRF